MIKIYYTGIILQLGVFISAFWYIHDYMRFFTVFMLIIYIFTALTYILGLMIYIPIVFAKPGTKVPVELVKNIVSNKLHLTHYHTIYVIEFIVSAIIAVLAHIHNFTLMSLCVILQMIMFELNKYVINSFWERVDKNSINDL